MPRQSPRTAPTGRWKFVDRLFEVKLQLQELEDRCTPATFVVTTISDSGAGSLRQAILNANAAIGADTIAFGIGSGPQTIGLTSGLPPVTDPLTIDGSTQPGSGGLPVIRVDGGGAFADALTVTSGGSGSVINRLIVTGFAGRAIHLSGASNTAITGNYLGVLGDALTAAPNVIGVYLDAGSHDNTVGGPSGSNQINVISGNTANGVLLDGSGTAANAVLGNWIGLGSASKAVPNGGDGVYLVNGSHDNVIGAVGAGNFVGGNALAGVRLVGAGTTGNVVAANFIGTSFGGGLPRPNADGVVVEGGASANTIGGGAAGAGNLISGNAGVGVRLAAPGNVVAGNLIGLNAAGTSAVGNSVGVQVTAGGNRIGTDGNGANDDNERNVISGNANEGVLINGGDNTRVAGNFIGTDTVGLLAVPNQDGASISGSAGVVIGTDGSNDAFNANERNIISGNANRAVLLDGQNVVAGNWIGLDKNGAALGNQFGIQVTGVGGRVGTNADGIADTAERNVISGNSIDGIIVRNAGTTGVVIAGNFIGTNVAGDKAVGNGAAGVNIAYGASGNAVGGTAVGTGNVISGNTGNGVEITGTGTGGNLVAGNYINLNAAGTATFVNSNAFGIAINGGATNNLVGGSVAARNVIAGYRGGVASSGVGIVGAGTSNNRVQSNYIGTDATGNNALANGYGVFVYADASGNILGTDGDGTNDAAEGNVISGNAVGVWIQSNADNTVIAGNLIGVAANGTALGNVLEGIRLFDASINGTRIGTDANGVSDALERNVISGNGSFGIDDSGADGTIIAGNYVGTNAAGTAALGIQNFGVNFQNATNAKVGGTASAARNVVSGNVGSGIGLALATSKALIQGNYVGLNAAGTGAVANGSDGIHLEPGVSNTTIGGTTVGARNIVSGNAQHGVYIGSGTTGTVIQGNFIGTDATGFNNVGNVGDGINIGGPVQIGGLTATPGTGAGNVISGNGNNALDNFGNIYNGGASGVVIQGNIIGLDAAGNNAIRPTTQYGVWNYLADGATIGGATTTARNIISGNNIGLLLQDGSGLLVQNNYIGTDITGNLDRGNTVYGITSSSKNSIFRDNVVSGNDGVGLSISGESPTAKNIQVVGNVIGLNAAGTAKLGNTTQGLVLNGATDITVGGNDPGDRNIVSGNAGTGIAVGGVASTGIVILGNYIGLAADGVTALGNVGAGVTIAGDVTGAVIGGTTAGSGNVIGGNTNFGVLLDGATTTGTLVQGNFIGTDFTGTLARTNFYGVQISGGASGNTVGGTTVGARNVISGNAGIGSVGVFITGAGTSNNAVLGNYVGVAADGSTSLGNTTGVYIYNGTTGNRIGSGAAGAGNVIAGNDNDIAIFADQNFVQGNRISVNAAETAAIAPTGGYGISIFGGASKNFIGTDSDGLNDATEGNIIGLASTAGIYLSNGGGAPDRTVIAGNRLGLASNGTTLLNAGGSRGIWLDGSTNTRIGSNADGTNDAGERNLIVPSATSQGILLTDGNIDTVIAGNYIGLNETGTKALSTGGQGISVQPTTVANTNLVIGGNTAAARNVIGGLDIGIILANAKATGITISGNYIGTNAAGTGALPNSVGIFIQAGANANTIGGTTAGARNVISGNLSGIVIQGEGSTGNKIQGNYIGTDFSGTADLGNLGDGILVFNGANGTIIGGPSAIPGTGAGNVISGNGDGNSGNVHIEGVTLATTGTAIQGNMIGLNAAGTAKIETGKSQYGIYVQGAPVLIGGTVAGAGNVISGHTIYGVDIELAGSAGTLVQGNLIGLAADGATAVSNGFVGVELATGATGVTIGGTTVAARNVISGNANFGVLLTGVGTSGNTVAGNFIGTDKTGAIAKPNDVGVQISGGAANNTIGGTTAGAGNVISGNSGAGVTISGTGTAGNAVSGNYIGVNAAGTAVLGNLWGVLVEGGSGGNFIGGAVAGAGNLISGSTIYGVGLRNGADNNTVQGNLIGTNAAGNGVLGGGGVYVADDGTNTAAGGAANNLIGGTSPGARNVIAGSAGAGVIVLGPRTAGTRILGNSIGTDAAGNLALGNKYGVVLNLGATNVAVGGTAAGAGNTIAFNTAGGVVVLGAGTRGDPVRGNAIYANGGLGIDLGNDGVTANVAPSAASQTRPNLGQNFPVLAFVGGGASTSPRGLLNAAANRAYTLDFYANTAPDPRGYGQGRRYLGSATVTTDALGRASFSVTLAAATTTAEWVSATATDPAGNTSEFAQNLLADVPPAVALSAPSTTSVGVTRPLVPALSGGVPGLSYQYQWSVTLDGRAVALPDATVLSTTAFDQETLFFTPQRIGRYVVTVTVTDSRGGVASQSTGAIDVKGTPLGVTVTGATTATPVPFNLTVGVPTTLTSTIADPRRTAAGPKTGPARVPAYTYAWSVTRNGVAFPLPAGTVTNAATFTYTPTGAGNYLVSLAVTDTSAAAGVTTVLAAGADSVAQNAAGAPAATIAVTPGTAVAAGTRVFAQAIVADLAQRRTLSYAWTVTPDNGQPATAVTNTTGVLNFNAAAAGNYVTGVTVTDDQGRSKAAPAVTVRVSRAAPAVTISGPTPGTPAPTSATPGVPLTLTGTATDADPNVAGSGSTNTYTLSWTTFSAGGVATPASGSGSSFTFTPSGSGLVVVTLTATDQKGFKTSTPLVISVAGAARAVAVTPPANPTQGGVLTWSAALTPAAPGATYEWTVFGPDGTTKVYPTGTAASLTLPGVAQAGRYDVTVRATAGGATYAASAPDAGTFVVVPHAPISLSIAVAPPVAPRAAFFEGDTVRLTSSATEPGVDLTNLGNASYLWVVTGPGGFSQVSVLPSLDVRTLTAGAYNVSLTVRDYTGGSATRTTSFAVDHAPPVPALRFTDAGADGTVGFQALVANPGGAYSFKYTVTFNGQAYLLQTAGGASYSFRLPALSGPALVRVDVTDSANKTGSLTTTVQALAAGVAKSVGATDLLPGSNTAVVLALGGNTVGVAADFPTAGTVEFIAVGGNNVFTGGAQANVANVFYGDSGTNALNGGAGPNTFYASGGDTVKGGAGANLYVPVLIPATGTNLRLQSGSGANTIDLSQLSSASLDLSNTAGSQVLNAASGQMVQLSGAFQTVLGTAGNDTITAASGAYVEGGGGRDLLTVKNASNATLVGGSGNANSLVAGTGATNISLVGGSGSQTYLLADAGVSKVTLIGGSGQSNTLVAGTGSTSVSLVGGSGSSNYLFADAKSANVTLVGGSGNSNSLVAGTGTTNVTLVGGSGQSNTLVAGTGSTSVSLVGGSGNSNSLVAGAGSTSVSLIGGSGQSNSLVAGTGSSNVTLVGGSGQSNTLVAGTGSSNVTLVGGSGNSNSLVAGGGSTSVSVVGGSGQSNTLVAGTGSTNVTLVGGSGNSNSLLATTGNVTLVGGSGNSNSLVAGQGAIGVSLVGGSGNSNSLVAGAGSTSVSLIGGSGQSNSLVAGTGNVTLVGGSGNSNSLVAGQGAIGVSLVGGSGNSNSLVAGTGSSNVTLVGGSGSKDVLVAGTGSSSVTLVGGSGGSNSLLAQAGSVNVSVVGGSGGNNLLFAEAGAAAVTLVGGSGNSNSLVAGTGSTNVTLVGGSGQSNTLVAGAGSSNVSLVGGSGNSDSLYAGVGAANVTLVGGSGSSNTLVADTKAISVSLVGGSGARDSLVALGGTGVTLVGGSGDGAVLSATNVAGGLLVGGLGQGARLSVSGNNSDLTLVGGSGDNDTLTATAAAGEVLRNVLVVGGFGNRAVLSAANVQGGTLIGGFGSDDSLTATNSNNLTLIGGFGDRAYIKRVGGNSNYLLGQSGNRDSLISTGGGDGVSLVGGSGSNLYLSDDGSTNVSLLGGTGGADTLVSVNGTNVTLLGGNGSRDSVSATGGTNVTLVGGTGDSNTLSATNLNTATLLGGSGNLNTITVTDSTKVLAVGGTGGGNKLSNVRGSFNDLVNGGNLLGTLSTTGGASINLFGGGGTDSLSAVGGTNIGLYGENGDNTYSVSGTAANPFVGFLDNLGTVGLEQSATDNLQSGTNSILFPAADRVVIDLGLSVGGAASSAETRSATQAVSTGVSLYLVGLFNNVTGSAAGNDFIRGNAVPNSLVAGGGNSTLVAGAGEATLVAGSGTTSLVGGAGRDTYAFRGPGRATVAQANADNSDTIDLSGLGGAATLDLTSTLAQTVGGGLTLTLASANALGIVGSAFGNTLSGNTRDNRFTLTTGTNTVTDGGGFTTFRFLGNSLGATVITPSAASSVALDFHGLGAPVGINLAQATQSVAGGTVRLAGPLGSAAVAGVVGTTFGDVLVGNSAPGAPGVSLVGGGGRDSIVGGSGADYLQAGATQVVYLDFDTYTPLNPGAHVYTQPERDAVQERLRVVYAAFLSGAADGAATDANGFYFTQNLAAAQSMSRSQGGRFATISFNKPPVGGQADEVDFGNADLGGSASVNASLILGYPRQPDPTTENFVALTGNLAAHELAHLLGLRHTDSFGPIGTGAYEVYQNGVPVGGIDPTNFFPAYQPAGEPLTTVTAVNSTSGATAVATMTTTTYGYETPLHLMGSPASVGTTRFDALGPITFGEREAIRAAFGQTGVKILAQSAPHATQSAAQDLGVLPGLAVPNTLGAGAVNAGKSFAVAAIAVAGRIGLDAAGHSLSDWYSFAGVAGDSMNFEVNSAVLPGNADSLDTIVRVYDSAGNLLASNDDEYETKDSLVIDFRVPADGKYFVQVDSYSADPANNTSRGNYILYLYSFRIGAGLGGGSTLVAGSGQETIVAGSGADLVRLAPGNHAPLTVVGGSGAATVDQTAAFGAAVRVLAGSPLGSVTQLLGAPAPLSFSGALRLNPTVGKGGQLAFSAAVAPPAGRSVTYALSPVPGSAFPAGAAIRSNTGDFAWTAGDPGTYRVRVTATAPDGTMVSADVTITVNAVAPIINPVAPQSAPVGTAVALRGSIANFVPDDSYTYTWSASLGGVVKATFAGQSFAFNPGIGGSYTVTLTVRDNQANLSSAATTTVSVTDVRLVVAPLADTTVSVGDSAPFAATPTYPGAASAVTLSWVVTDAAGHSVASGTGPSFAFAPPDIGAYTVTFTASAGGLSASTSAIITANPVAPTATPPVAVSVSKGSPVTLSFTNPYSPSAAVTATGFHYSFATSLAQLATTYAAAGASPSVVFTSASYGPVTVYGRVIDKNGSFTDYQIAVAVLDVPVSVTGVGPLAAVKKSPTGSVKVATFTDTAGTGDITQYAATIDWGDGTAPTAGTITAAADGKSFGVFGTHTYALQGSYAVTVAVAHGAFPAVAATSQVVVGAPALAGTGNFAVAATRGADTGLVTVATFTDPAGPDDFSTYSALIAWGDGTTSAGAVTLSGATYAVKGSHAYAATGAPAISVTLRHTGSPDVAVTSRATVTNPALVGQSGGLAATRSAPTGLVTVATFTDAAGPDPVSAYSATIKWGDGTPDTAGTITLIADGRTFTVAGSHTYAAAGTTPVTVTIRRAPTDLAPAVVATSAVVSNPAVSATAVPVSATAGVALSSVAVARFTDPSGADALGSYSATINWGDGTAATAGAITLATDGRTFTVAGSHTYAAAGPYTATVTITHAYAPTAAVSVGVTVKSAAVAPVTPTGGGTLNFAGAISSAPVVATFTDPAGADAVGNYSATVSWGDGTTSAGTVTLAGANRYAVTAAHAYFDLGNSAITVTILHGSASATATATASVGTSIIALNPTLSGAVTLSGSAAITIGGALVVNSNSASALSVSGAPKITAGSIRVVGGVQSSGSPTVTPAPSVQATPLADPLAGLPAPANPGGAPVSAVYTGSGSYTLNPGLYSQITVGGSVRVTLNPGVYVIAGGGLSVSGAATVTGSGVLIYNAGSAFPAAGGSYGGISVGGSGVLTLTPARTGTYAGITLFQPRDNNRAITISGAARDGVGGFIYAPTALLTLSGSISTVQTGIIVDRLNTSGSVTSSLVASGAGTTDTEAGGVAGELLSTSLYVYVENAAGAFTIDDLARIDAAIAGIDALLEPLNVTVQEVTDPALANVTITRRATTIVGGQPEGVLGLYDPQRGEIDLVAGWDWYAGADPVGIASGQFDLQTVVTHELGHALGLAHSPDPASVLYAMLRPGDTKRTLAEADLNIGNAENLPGALRADLSGLTPAPARTAARVTAVPPPAEVSGPPATVAEPSSPAPRPVARPDSPRVAWTAAPAPAVAVPAVAADSSVNPRIGPATPAVLGAVLDPRGVAGVEQATGSAPLSVGEAVSDGGAGDGAGGEPVVPSPPAETVAEDRGGWAVPDWATELSEGVPHGVELNEAAAPLSGAGGPVADSEASELVPALFLGVLAYRVAGGGAEPEDEERLGVKRSKK